MSKFTVQHSHALEPVSGSVDFSYQTGLLSGWMPTLSSNSRLGGAYNITQVMVNASEINGVIHHFLNDDFTGYMQDLQKLSTPNTWWTLEIDTDNGAVQIQNITVLSVVPLAKYGVYRYKGDSFNIHVEANVRLSYNKETPFSP